MRSVAFCTESISCNILTLIIILTSYSILNLYFCYYIHYDLSYTCRINSTDSVLWKRISVVLVRWILMHMKGKAGSWESMCSYVWQDGEDGGRFDTGFEFCQSGAERQQDGHIWVNNPSYSSFSICFLILNDWYCILLLQVACTSHIVIKNHSIWGLILQPLLDGFPSNIVKQN